MLKVFLLFICRSIFLLASAKTSIKLCSFSAVPIRTMSSAYLMSIRLNPTIFAPSM